MGISGVLRAVLTAMREGGPVDMRLVDALITKLYNKTVAGYTGIAEDRFFKALDSAEPDLRPLREMLRERSQYYGDVLSGYRFVISKFNNPAAMIGRKGQDLVRELSLDTLEEGFLRGNPTAFTSPKLAEQIAKKGTLFDSAEAAAKALNDLKFDVVKKIPLFHEDGRAKFLLQVKTDGEYRGAFRKFDVQKYADLVGITTAGEADGASSIAQASEIKSRIVKWNTTGKGKDFYRSIGDYRCANVDGEYASLEPEGTTINGIFYPYIHSEERLPGPYLTCHPHCRHRFVAVPEETL